MAFSWRLGPKARADLEDIFLYTVEHWSVAQADRYILDLEEQIALLAEAPDRGRNIDNIRKGYRTYAVRSHLIVYRPSDSGIDVMRILHRSMDVPRHL